MNHKLYHEKLRLLRAEGNFDDRMIAAFTSWVTRAEDLDLLRMNPLQVASELGTDSHQLTEFFIHGSRAGLFDFSWSMICPSCGEIQNNDHSLNSLSGEFFCVVCQVPVRVNIDDTVEVTFSLNPSVRPLNIDPFRDPQTYRRVFFSQAVDRSPEILALMEEIWVGFESVPPGETLIVDRSWERGRSYRLVSAGVHSQFLFHISPQAAEESEFVEVDFGETGMHPQELTLSTLNPKIRIRNRRQESVGLMMVKADFPRLHQIMKDHPSRLKPLLTGNQLLNTQKFRQLFRIQSLSPTLRLNIRSLTLLFTDLKGSTELYDRTGDVDAYTLIQDHFQLLGSIVARHGGAVIKTMGDAVMASFSRPADGVGAALEMLEEIRTITRGNHALGLKIGLHEGPALAINNQGSLDYFGQTVNIAARVQGLAGENSVWMTESVLRAKGSAQLLKNSGFSARRYLASLKGVGEKTTVYEMKKKELL